MNVSRFAWRLCGVLPLLLLASAAAQEPAKSVASEEIKQVVTREFGSGFELLDFAPLLMDIDGDGIEDAVIVATSKNPLLDAVDRHYKVIDPYDDYFGLGDPKITAGFSPTLPGPPRFLLVIHAWKTATPKAKFVIINLPFEKLAAGRAMRKKKAIAAITAEESGGLVSAIFWDGKKYKWEPTYMGQ